MSTLTSAYAAPVLQQNGYRLAGGLAYVVTEHRHPAGTFRADIPVPSTRPEAVTDAERAEGVTGNFQRFAAVTPCQPFTYADAVQRFAAGDAVTYTDDSGYARPCRVTAADARGVTVELMPGWEILTGHQNGRLAFRGPTAAERAAAVAVSA